MTFIAVSTLLAALVYKLESKFADTFAANLLALLTTLFAINIASSTLIAGKLREIQSQTGHPFTNTKKNLKSTFYEQIWMIALALMFGLIRESQYLKEVFGSGYLIATSNAVLFFTFIYYLDIIRDIGKSLFDLLDYNPNSNG